MHVSNFYYRSPWGNGVRVSHHPQGRRCGTIATSSFPRISRRDGRTMPRRRTVTSISMASENLVRSGAKNGGEIMRDPEDFP